MLENTLFFCRTPLQALIINKLLETNSNHHHIIYRPNNESEKHKYYFSKLATEHKTFLPFEPVSFSHALSSIFDWLSLPRKIRHSKYDQLYIASIGDMVFSFFSARNRSAKINLFDDGIFNLNKNEFNRWVQSDSLQKKILRKILNGEKTTVTHERISHHYSIYPSNLCWLNCETTELKGLFKIDDKINADFSSKKKKLRVLVGSAYIIGEVDDDFEVLKNRNLQHEKIINSDKFDVYIPHPAHKSEAKFEVLNKDFISQHPLNLMIAEDIISVIHNSGYELIIYGFISSTLANLSKDYKTVGIMTDKFMLDDSYLLKQLGAKILKVF